MGLTSQLSRFKELAEAGGVWFQPPLRADTIAERTARSEMQLPEEIVAFYTVCDGAELDSCVSLLPLSRYIDVRSILTEIAREMDEEEWRREYHPFAHYNGDLTLCLELPSRKVRVLDVECSVINDVAETLDVFLSALERALVNGGVAPGEYGGSSLPGWGAAAREFGIGKIWNSGVDEAKS